MKLMALKNKLLTGSLAMSVLVMITSALVVSMVINKQNRIASYQNIEKSLNIIREDLSMMWAKLLADTQQMATINGMGPMVKFVSDFNDNQDMINEYLRKITYSLGQIGETGNLWKAAIYDIKGQLNAFAVKQSGGGFLLGFTSNASTASFNGGILKDGKQLMLEDWKDLGNFQDPKIKFKFDQDVPLKESILFEEIANNICIVSYVPIFAQAYNKETNSPEDKQVGLALGIRKLDEPFAKRVSRLTTMNINIFTKDGLSLGDMEDYKALKAKMIRKSVEDWDLRKGKIMFNDVDLKEDSYFQGILTIYGDSRIVGAIAALQSTDIVKSNTWQMIRLLGLVYLGCILMIVPCAIIFSSSLTKPINKTIKILTAASQKVSSASAQVSSSSIQLAESASEQAASLEEASSSLEELSSTTKNNAESANEVDNLTNEANLVVAKANDSMKVLTSSMEEISKASEETSKIVKTIDEIAFQTNLLALNAAVEAARAGEAGAGFAVVADEVRSLAMRAADAAGNTAELIEDTVKKIKEGTGLVAGTAGTFAEVTESSQKVGELTGEIAAASEEQAQGIEQINRVVTEMDKVIQENASNVEESASASQELNSEAGQMKKVVNDLVALVSGSAVVKNEILPL